MTPAAALLITCDEQLLDDLLRLAAAAGVALDVAHDAGSALRGWSSASVVLLGTDLAARVADQGPPRREQVHVVGHGPLPGDVFRTALGVGALDVVELPSAEAWVVEVLTDAVDAGGGPGRDRGRLVGVVAGSGGAGATTLACAVAAVAARDRSAMLVDLDPWGPGVDRVVGLEPGGGVHWDALVSSRGRLGSRSLRAALPRQDELSVLTWAAGAPVPLDAPSVREILSAGRRGHDLVVLDLPRAVDDLTAEVVTRCDQVVVVVDPSIAGIAAAAKLSSVLSSLTGAVGLAVRSRIRAVPAEQVAGVIGLPLVVEVPHQRRLAEQVDLGLGPVRSRRSALARAAGVVLSSTRTVAA